MNAEMPEGYLPGISIIESLGTSDLTEWLRTELAGESRTLSGQDDDFPVQAIVNHFRYLSPTAQRRLTDAVDLLQVSFKTSPANWMADQTRNLFHLIGELPVPALITKLQTVAFDTELKPVIGSSYLILLQAIARHSTNTDRAFWKSLVAHAPQYAGMALQVLARVSPNDVLEVLEQLPPKAATAATLGAFARALPNFLASLEDGDRSRAISRLDSTRRRLPSTVSYHLRGALAVAGFGISAGSAASHGDQELRFGRHTTKFVESFSQDSYVSA